MFLDSGTSGIKTNKRVSDRSGLVVGTREENPQKRSLINLNIFKGS